MESKYERILIMENIDYKKLLEKYRQHVEWMEGVDFVFNMMDTDKYGDVQFTKEEIEFMQSISPDYKESFL